MNDVNVNANDDNNDNDDDVDIEEVYDDDEGGSSLGQRVSIESSDRRSISNRIRDHTDNKRRPDSQIIGRSSQLIKDHLIHATLYSYVISLMLRNHLDSFCLQGTKKHAP